MVKAKAPWAHVKLRPFLSHTGPSRLWVQWCGIPLPCWRSHYSSFIWAQDLWFQIHILRQQNHINHRWPSSIVDHRSAFKHWATPAGQKGAFWFISDLTLALREWQKSPARDKPNVRMTLDYSPLSESHSALQAEGLVYMEGMCRARSAVSGSSFKTGSWYLPRGVAGVVGTQWDFRKVSLMEKG